MPRALMKMKLAPQLWILILIPLALALGAFDLITQAVRQQVLIREASAELRNNSILLQVALKGAVERDEVPLLKQRLEDMATGHRILGIAAFDAHGEPLLVTDEIAPATSILASIARHAIEKKRDFEQQRLIEETPTLVRTVTFSPHNQDRTVVAVVARDLGYLPKLRNTLTSALALMSLILIGFIAAIVALVSRATVGGPVNAIVDGATRVASGELDTHVAEGGAEELVKLARAFNEMTSSLREARARAEKEEIARAEVERKLRHAQALAAVGQVAASIAHEMGSPLNVILGRARRAADLPGCPEAFRGELETIAAQSERISRVVARLLAVARPEEGSGRGCSLVQVVHDTLAFLGAECRQRRVRARFDTGGASPRVALDGDRMFQIVFNLCLNAVQAQPDGGELIVRIVPPSKRGDSARRVAFEVEDTGPGVPESFREHIFEPFFTSKGKEGGSGLGLAIVAGILREAGGSVELRKGASGGACFHVTLPVVAGTNQTDAAEART